MATKEDRAFIKKTLSSGKNSRSNELNVCVREFLVRITMKDIHQPPVCVTQGWLSMRLLRGALRSCPWALKGTVDSCPPWRLMEERPSSSSAPLAGINAGPSSGSTESSSLQLSMLLSSVLLYSL